MNNYLKGNNLIKIHNCFKCHKNYNNNIPKIKGQYREYIIWTLNQYKINFKKNIFSRKNFLMKSQLQNLNFKNLNYIINFLNNFKIINLKIFKNFKNLLKFNKFFKKF